MPCVERVMRRAPLSRTLPRTPRSQSSAASQPVALNTPETKSGYSSLMADDGSTYIHGTDPDEQRRLGLMNTILNAASLRELRLLGGEKILELGSGLGQFARLMARTAGAGGRVVGIERSVAQRAEAVRQAREDGEETLVEFRAGDALALSLGDGERGTFDIAHTRFLLEHVQRPLEVVRAMVRA